MKKAQIKIMILIAILAINVLFISCGKKEDLKNDVDKGSMIASNQKAFENSLSTILSDQYDEHDIEIRAKDNSETLYSAGIKEIKEITVVNANVGGGHILSIVDENNKVYCLIMSDNGIIHLIKKGDVKGEIIYSIDFDV